MWLEPLAFQEELVKSLTFHNFADPILHNIVVKDVFAWVSVIQQTSEINTVIENTEVNRARKDVIDMKQKVQSLQSEPTTLKTELSGLSKEYKNTNETCEDNLKYLINSDRNTRRHNLMSCDVPEREELVLDGEYDDDSFRASTDNEKVHAISSRLGYDMNEVTQFFRLGKEGEKPRPLKIVLKSVDHARQILTHSKNLSDLNININM